MLLLVCADRDKIRLIEQNIRRHEDRISEKANVDIVRMLCGFILKLRHARHLAELGIAVEHPGKLRMSWHLALDKDEIFLRIQADGEQQGV